MKFFKPRFDVKDIARAYNRSKFYLHASEVKNCCGDAKYLVVNNQMVVLREMLLKLGFSTIEIDQDLHES